MRLHLDRTASPLGEILLVTDDAGALRGLDFADHAARLHQLLRRQNGDYALDEAPAPATTHRALADYFAGDLDAIDALPIATGGTAFQRSVWQALRNIPAGATTSYGALATTLSHPRASRAVGLANGANPISIVLPCHRVIGADGSLTGYGGGLPRKRWLLEHERRHRSA
ncbi:MAG TPA: methylated-DNA--[protein]-cysteine S-methyltransferase [Candidatus Sulfotelmatobacter sp.]|nr:methylated-DNA--[protein]-cysteine S-methyltransferase [Candidatus Sulfotelmatobacter sp.]